MLLLPALLLPASALRCYEMAVGSSGTKCAARRDGTQRKNGKERALILNCKSRRKPADIFNNQSVLLQLLLEI